jgi:hypothetical protein
MWSRADPMMPHSVCNACKSHTSHQSRSYRWGEDAVALMTVAHALVAPSLSPACIMILLVVDQGLLESEAQHRLIKREDRQPDQVTLILRYE